MSKVHQEYTLFLVAFFVQEKTLVWDPNSEICFVLSLFRRRKLLSKIIHFGCIFATQIDIMFGVEFGVENRPEKESFGVDLHRV
jgi:hypothetical protein